ncbi:hypothetical protein D3C84_617910 [compost metagenome]
MGQAHQLAALAEPLAGDVLGIALRVEQLQVLLADLDQVGMGGEGFDTLAPEGDIRLDVKPHIGVEADQALVALTADQLEQGIGDRRDHQRIGANMQAAHPRIQHRQVLAAQQAIGTALAAERILRRTMGIHSDHRQGGGRIAGYQVVGAHPFFSQNLTQADAEVIAGNTGEQRRIDAKPAQTDRDIEGRTAGNRLEIQLAAARSGLRAEEIEQGFAAYQIHGCLHIYRSLI